MDPLSDIKAVLFDFDDTLVQTREAKWAHHKHVASSYGHLLADDDLALHWGKPFPQLVGILYHTTDIEEATARNKASRHLFPKQAFEWTSDLLGFLRRTGKKTGIVTATIRDNLLYDLDSLGIPADAVDYVQAAEDTAFHKPDPRVFDPALAWLKEQGINPEETLYVGDGLHDMAAAQGAGFRFLGVETGLVTWRQFKANGMPCVPHAGCLLPDRS